MTPNIQEGINIARKELPDLDNIQTYGPISRLLMGNKTNAFVSPARQIYLNPSSMAGHSPQDVADTLMHEQTHVRQMNERGQSPLMEFLSTIMGNEQYARRPDEMEAYQAEFERRKRMGRSQTAIPDFRTGVMKVPTDIHLNTAPTFTPGKR